MNDRRDYLLSLVEFAKQANLEEVVLEQGDKRFSFKRNIAPPKPAPLKNNPAPKSPAAPKTHFILSPMVGTFMRAPKDRPPYVVEGGEVEAGQRVAVVEAMKVPKEVVSGHGGKILKILVENGKPVEYGQKLFEVDPNV